MRLTVQSCGLYGIRHNQRVLVVNFSAPLKCWQTLVKPIASEADTRITDLSTPSIDCSGICYVRQTIATPNGRSRFIID